MSTVVEINIKQLSLIPGYEKNYKKEPKIVKKNIENDKEYQKINENENLIYYVLKDLKLYNEYGFQEYYDLGMIGLIKGIKTFDKTKGFKLSSYLLKCIKNEILLSFKTNNNSCYYPTPLSSLETPDGEEFIIPSDYDLEKEVIKRERIKIIMDYLNNEKYFTSRDKYIFLRLNGFYCLGMSVEELSADLNLDRSTIFKISKKVQNKLEQLVRGTI